MIMKHSTHFIFCLVAAFGLTSPLLAQGIGDTFTEDGLYFKVTAVEPLAVEVASGTVADGTLAIGNTVEHNGSTYAITSIGGEAFKGSGITMLDLSRATNLQRIGAAAFGENKTLESVIFPVSESSSLVEIGPLAFHHDTGLKSINLEDTHITVLEALFTRDDGDEMYFDNLTELRLPESLTEIKSYALQFLGIRKMTIPAGVTTIGDGILEGNIYLEEVSWKGAQVTSIPRYTFLGDDALRKVSILTVNPLEPTGLTDKHFFMCDKELLTVYVTQESYDSLLSGGYDNETTVYSTLAVDTEWTTGIEDVRAGHCQANTISEGPVFNLRGQRVVLTRQGEVYIRGGKKFVAR